MKSSIKALLEWIKGPRVTRAKLRLCVLGWDLVLVLGCLVFVYGVSLFWRPAAFMVGGILLIAASLLLGAPLDSKIKDGK